MKNKKLIIGICIVIVIMVIAVPVILNNVKYNKDMVGTYYASAFDTTYTLGVKKNHTAIITFEDGRIREYTWDNKHFNDEGVLAEYTFSDNKLTIKYVRGTVVFSKSN